MNWLTRTLISLGVVQAILTVAMMVLGAGHPAFAKEPPKTEVKPKKVMVLPVVDLEPQAPSVVPMPQDTIPERESTASVAAERLDRLDDQVIDLKAQCDALPTRGVEFGKD